MRSSDKPASRRASGRRRSVEFATIDEEPPEFSLRPSQASIAMSDISITVDDLDQRAFNRDRSSLDLPPNSDRRLSSTERASRQRSSQTGLVSALRRFTHSRFSSQSDNPLGGTDQQHPPTSNNHPTISDSPRARHDRRTTIFSRQRQSIGTRGSSLTASQGSDPDESNMREVYCLSDAKIHALRHIIDHPASRGITFFFILALLFGPPIQDLWLPTTADGVMDGVYTLGFVVLSVDIIIRAIVDKSYFAWNRKGRSWPAPVNNNCCNFPKRCNLHAGSFMFWFDTLALLTILYHISYINPSICRPQSVRVELTEFGFPVGGQHATPLSVDWSLVLTIGRVGLMARFIRTSVLVQISSSSFWLRYFLPRYWILKLTSKREVESKNNLASQRALASTSTGRAERRTSDPLSVSSLGDSKMVNRRSMQPETEGQLETFTEGSEPDAPEDSKLSSKKDFFKGFRKKSPDVGADTLGSKSTLFGKNKSKDSRSHVGAAMRELTGQRVATGILLALIVTLICNWYEEDTTKVMTMLTLHSQTANAKFAEFSVNIARASVIPTLFNYTRANEMSTIFSETYELSNGNNLNDLREREILIVDVRMNGSDVYTYGKFDNSQVTIEHARVELVTTILILIVWVLGVASFAGPVMTLVVEPIERMVRLLSMLMKDPLGYSSSPQYRELKQEDDEVSDKSMMWPKEVLKGMETNFLMSTILRIGSLMRVGFGSAGVEIIRGNLERGRHKDVLFLNKQGSSVSCIFLFCDIRQFTDATECLQEEVFVFTNKIAAVVHSICHSYEGSANKNIGDAFLLSWLLDEAPSEEEEDGDDHFRPSSNNLNLGKSDLRANSNQADKALLSVVKISMALYYDRYFTDGMNEVAKK
mmetsp:Transcript_20885/g.45261  ORF Transcript_20885/g.45261 Transcript_20885/m.45261 type:complete len:875 (-) Transcript_20885:15-2639(-)